MKKIISVVLCVIITVSCFAFTGTDQLIAGNAHIYGRFTL